MLLQVISSLLSNPHQPFLLSPLHTVNTSIKILYFAQQDSAMLRSFTTRRYERLGKESASSALLHEGFKRSTTLPSQVSSSASRKMAHATFGNRNINLQRNPTKKASNSSKNTHPLFSFLDFRRKRKTTARPEFTRYLEYLKEGGMWDLNSNKPVMYYK